MRDSFDLVYFEKKIKLIGEIDEVFYFPELVSTSNFIKESVERNKKALVVCDYQSGGRGRKDYKEGKKNRWECAWACGLLFTFRVFIRNKVTFANMSQIVAYTLVKIIKRDFGIFSVQIKWPNDILIGEKKLGGILCESEKGVNSDLILNIGVGINFYSGGYSEGAVLEDFAELGGHSREDFLINFLDEFFKDIEKWEQFGFIFFRDKIWEHSYLCDSEVEITLESGKIRAKALGLSRDGELIVENENGELRINSVLKIRKIV